MSNVHSRTGSVTDEQQPLLPAKSTTAFLSENDAQGQAKRVRKTITGLFSLINCVLPSLVEPEDITRCDSTIITKDTVQYALQLARLAGGQNGEVVEPYHVIYCALRCVAAYQHEAEKDASWTSLMQQRALAAQVLAKNLLHSFQNRLTLNFNVLLQKYHAEGEEVSSASCVIEIAIEIHATMFLSDYEVQKCINTIWEGGILQNEDSNGNTYFVAYEQSTSGSIWQYFNPERLQVPKYQDALRIVYFLGFLALYTYVVNNRTTRPEPLEWMMYTFVMGYIFEEIRLIYEGGVFYLYSIWHWINIGMYLVFFVSFAFRILALTVHHAHKKDAYNDIAYDLLSIMAIFLWVKTVSLLDGFKFIGNMIIILQAMIKDSFMFFSLLPWGFIGFLQSFYALGGGNDKDDELGLLSTFSLLSRAFLADANFAQAEEYHNVYGAFLFGLYLFFTVVLLLNILVALFNSSYSRITEQSESEYLALFTFKVFSYLKSPDQFPFPAPLNLIEVLFIIPTSLVMSEKGYARLNHAVLSVLLWAPLMLIAWHESRHLVGPSFEALDTILHEQLKSDANDVMAHQITRGFLPLNVELENGETKLETYLEYQKRQNLSRFSTLHHPINSLKGKEISGLELADLIQKVQQNHENLLEMLTSLKP
ncbi:hypothetical protein K493DRAFT_288651 [Basidiobolus meristosporus CBS 931.73]|uniref:Uncharacterized protein n=1 Tax=Basidiobolus meristosporus CBS 931.73 TaxID=1314790 RepID=A0A1Y1XW19_9FUNG|nr:hypothetical protein K493DRAFT_288651 [Basidiobolus meristosporus CBS 931.73]|eukprot:ORX89948.1 hypothetical protein K493DRAFT_288651 [Basidiobolus meristosporus CBS 931.73]